MGNGGGRRRFRRWPSARRSRAGASAGRLPPVRRLLARDDERLPSRSRLQACCGDSRRIKRQVHERADGAEGRQLRDAARPLTVQLPQLLLSPPALAVHRPQAREGSVMDAPRAQADPAFRADVLAGLAAPIPAIPARWLYDRRGSELFEKITELPEYYPTRTERALLERHCADVARIAGKGDAVIEFGSGSSTKTPILLRAVAPAAYVPIDISGDFLRDAAAALQADFTGQIGRAHV